MSESVPPFQVGSVTDVEFILPCKCKVTFIRGDANYIRLTKLCVEHLTADPVDQIKLLQQAEITYRSLKR